MVPDMGRIGHAPISTMISISRRGWFIRHPPYPRPADGVSPADRRGQPLQHPPHRPARGLTSRSCPVSRKTPIISLAGSDLSAAGNESMAHHSLQPAAIARAAKAKLQVRGASPSVRGIAAILAHFGCPPNLLHPLCCDAPLMRRWWKVIGALVAPLLSPRRIHQWSRALLRH
jgi:hypothetical protein